ncbi:MAG: hypothetical protein DMG14_06090 [Acidobacteria bacterium]|nr:MAG: hypothetical protein DMG14_06090 [Acidobacteriota bacterium]
MLSIVLSVLLLASPQESTFKKERAQLQEAVDTLVTSTGAQVLYRSRAAYLEGYGVVVSLEVAFEGPQNPFSGFKPPKEIQALIAQRRKDVQEKMSTLLKQRVATMDSIGATESLTVIIHVLNANPADVPNLPVQILMTAKKDSPQQPVAVRDF